MKSGYERTKYTSEDQKEVLNFVCAENKHIQEEGETISPVHWFLHPQFFVRNASLASNKPSVIITFASSCAGFNT